VLVLSEAVLVIVKGRAFALGELLRWAYIVFSWKFVEPWKSLAALKDRSGLHWCRFSFGGTPMSMLSIDNSGGILWLSGNVMPSEEKRLNEALRQYVQQTHKDDRVVDMSAVKYISSSAAKTLLTVAQESAARGGKLKVRSSIPVVRTLSLLGAETWCEVEPCREPNRKPGSPSTSNSRIMPAAPSKERSPASDSGARAAASASDSGTRTAAAGSRSETRIAQGGGDTSTPPALEDHKEVFSERKSTVGLNAPGTSIVRRNIGKSEGEDAMVKSAAAKAGLPLVNQDADLSDDLAPLKKLIVMKTYTFQMSGLKSDITGKVLARVGGPWVLIDTHGAKKMVNVREAAVIDILA